MPGYRPKVLFEGKPYFFDEEKRTWCDDKGKEVAPPLSFKLQGRFTDLR